MAIEIIKYEMALQRTMFSIVALRVHGLGHRIREACSLVAAIEHTWQASNWAGTLSRFSPPSLQDPEWKRSQIKKCLT